VILILGFIALIIPGIILAIMFSLALPALLLENKGVFDSMGRSRELVRHKWVKTFATFLVMAIIVAIGSAIVSAVSSPFGLASPVVNGVLSAFYQPLVPILMAVYFYSNLARIGPATAAQTTAAPSMMSQTGPKFCINCGAQLDSSATFCSKCGAKQTA
jgi:ribosomal protein L40E